MKIDDTLISSFRNDVNSYSGFVYQKYHNIGGKNKWNIICSCMDWISVAIRHLSNVKNINKDIDTRVMQFFSIITSITIVFDGITQIHRVLLDTTNEPFKGEYLTFKGNQLKKDDNSYFKEIRAMFGAHPVNLQHNNEKWYASWPSDFGMTNKMSFSIMLYSNKINIKDKKFEITIDDLEAFLLRRYNHLETLRIEIKNQYSSFCHELRQKKIPYSDDPIKKIDILLTESNSRFNTDYYNETLSELKKVFKITLSDSDKFKEEEISYKKQLIFLINEIYYQLQNIEFKEMNNYQVLYPDYSYGNIGYAISKLYTYDFNPVKEPLYDCHMKELDKFSHHKYNFIDIKDPDEVFLKLKLMLYYMSSR